MYDYTPMEFECWCCRSSRHDAGAGYPGHAEGASGSIGVCGVYPHDLAATKVQQVAAYSRKHQHPLQCVMEET